MTSIAVIGAFLVIELMKIIMTTLHSTVVCKYCNYLTGLGFKPSMLIQLNIFIISIANFSLIETVINYLGYIIQGFVWVSLLPGFQLISLAPFRESCNTVRRGYKVAAERCRRKMYDVDVLIAKHKWPEGGIKQLRQVVKEAAKSLIRWVSSNLV